MTCHATVTIEYGHDTIAGVRNRLTQNGGSIKSKVKVLRGFSADLRAILLGVIRAFVRVQPASACATMKITVDQSQAVDNTDTITIAGTTLSQKASPANESQYAMGGSTATLIANLVACINAHSVLQKIVRAGAADATHFTITCALPGPLGNLVTVSKAGNSLTLVGSALANGASDAMRGYSLGYTPSP